MWTWLITGAIVVVVVVMVVGAYLVARAYQE